MLRFRIASLIGPVLVLALIAGCGTGVVNSGWQESGGDDGWSAEFGAFDGSESHDIDPDGARELLLRYDVTLESGTITLAVRNQDGESAWTVTVSEDEQGEVEVPLPDPGSYTLTAFGDEVTGRFDVSWKRR